MRVLIGKPIRHIEMFREASEQGLMRNNDVEKLYNILPGIVDRLGFEPITIEMANLRRVYQEKNSIFLAWHSHGTTKNTWFVKQSYLPDYFYFDKTGYSGWSELTETYTHDVDVETIRDEVSTFATYYISNNISRFNQTPNNETPTRPYVLAFEQRPDDAVSDFAYIDNFIPKLQEAFRNTQYEVVVKPHPVDLRWSKSNNTWEWLINDTGSLHDLIANSTAVYTINSSAGFESLLHNKRVFTAGQCDYHWVTNVLKDDKDLVGSIELLTEPVDEDEITKFLHYCLNHHFMNVNDESSIERKILRAVEHAQR